MQKSWTIKQLLEHGRVSRNEALSQRITRLGAIINQLNREGYTITGNYVKENGGRNYYYQLVHAPVKKVMYTVPELNKTFTAYERQS